MQGDSVRAPKMQGDGVRASKMQGDSVRAPKMQGDSGQMQGDGVRVSKVQGDSVRAPKMQGDGGRASEVRKGSGQVRRGTRWLGVPVLLCALCLCMLGGCGEGTAPWDVTGSAAVPSGGEGGKVTREVFAMDTIMDLTIYGFRSGRKPYTEEELGRIMNRAVELINRLDGIFSVTDGGSDIARINAAGGRPVAVSEETYELVGRCLDFSKETGGLFDISIYPVVKAWGFTTGEYAVPTDAEVEAAKRKVDCGKIRLLSDSKVQIGENMQIDLGAAAKGYLSQKLMELFRRNGVESAIVSLGGNVQAMGVKEDGGRYKVGITDPLDGSSLYGTLDVGGGAVITSGVYQRYFERDGKTYHHIMDKRTGRPAENGLASVTVIAGDGARADALATALYVMGEEGAKGYQEKHPEIGLILIRKDGTFWQSGGVGMVRTAY